MAIIIKTLSFFLFLCCLPGMALAIVIKGKVYDLRTGAPIDNVNILNTFSQQGYTTDASGTFSLQVENGNLIEFRKIGYKIVRIRINPGEQPFYSIAMTVGAFDLDEVKVTGSNHKSDSLKNRNSYDWALNWGIENPEGNPLTLLAHPFESLSKRNRQIWQFQKRYQYFEREKFVDYVFNEKLIRKLALITDSMDLNYFRRFYRPSYEQIKTWTEYEFLEYIKSCGVDFKRRKQRDGGAAPARFE